jgi:chemotaxis protein histidine kinase CheA
MGLSVVMRIVNNYNGRIEVTNTGEAGTTFLIRLPLSVSVQEADDQYALFAQH